jgi:hypothetical protein
MKSFGARAALFAALVAVCFATVGGCGTGGDEPMDTERVSSPIVGGSTASAYPESALIEMSNQGVVRAACSGAVIAPQVVLTAGHCVDGFSGWNVRVPFTGQGSTASAAETFDWKSDGQHVQPSQHDVGLVYLDSPVRLAQYPALADGPVSDGSSVVTIGRIDDGVLSNSALFVSQPLSVTAAAVFGYPFDYISDQVIESGDSGGPVEVPGTTPHALVAVNSGAGSGKQVLARVDLVKSWISDRIATHGGGAVQPAPPTVSAPTCNGAVEVEPNDDFRVPNALGPSTCGALSGGDVQDWYGWSIDGAAPYTLRLAAGGDASVVMWKRVDGGYARVLNTSPTEISHTSSGAGSYVVAVFTPDGAAQSYSLTLTR